MYHTGGLPCYYAVTLLLTFNFTLHAVPATLPACVDVGVYYGHEASLHVSLHPNTIFILSSCLFFASSSVYTPLVPSRSVRHLQQACATTIRHSLSAPADSLFEAWPVERGA